MWVGMEGGGEDAAVDGVMLRGGPVESGSVSGAGLEVRGRAAGGGRGRALPPSLARALGAATPLATCATRHMLHADAALEVHLVCSHK